MNLVVFSGPPSSGKTSVIGFLVGQTMKQTQGKANPKELQTLIAKMLN